MGLALLELAMAEMMGLRLSELEEELLAAELAADIKIGR
jgi:hypothetical protein